nr:uncharacterized protein LOC100186384 [Ciona intestinalis]|eukprot:XP_009857885.1 uncharacterized protein LOC100186384 [Ciona intestinalis]
MSLSHSVRPKIIYLLPSEIRCSKTTVSTRVSSGIDVTDLLRQCLHGYRTIKDLTIENDHVITVMSFWGQYWMVDGHKRLWVLQVLQKMGRCGKIPVRVKQRKDYTLWRNLSTLVCPVGSVSFRFEDESERTWFEGRLNEVWEEMKRSEHGNLVKPIESRFLFATNLSEPARLRKMVDTRERNNGYIPWYKGPYDADRRLVMMAVLLFVVISLSVIGKPITEVEE